MNKNERTYFSLVAVLSFSCLLIFFFVKNNPLIRNTIGDGIVVMIIYSFFRYLFNTKPFFAGLISLVIAYGIELLQLVGIPEFLNPDSLMTKLILGSTFSVMDIVFYTLGVILIYWIDKRVILSK